MNDDFKEELKDCYAEIEQNRIDINEYRLDVERLRAALDTVRASGLLIGSTTLHDKVRAVVHAALAEEKQDD